MAKSLKIIIVIAAIVTVCTAITDEQKKKASVHAEKCMEKTGVRRDDVTKVLMGDFSVTDKNIECFVKCFFEESGFMNAEGEFLDEVALEKLSMNADRNKAEALVNTCKLRMASTPCETAYKIYQCYIEHKAI
ncbi:hypothetical protein HA402_009310 [Bradysia odoriphaga]|uniref:Odorant-binding protein 6 n=1 Tax=Bradysia odoriphaga TaxID=1564500 RepID=A0A2S0X9G1_9DIPT|nr:odorant-binding protein 6 [Bradysia odoriphaga]KAG4074885.1 hypothetical protein HA402_009310 [Bradysia odoriphaga]